MKNRTCEAVARVAQAAVLLHNPLLMAAFRVAAGAGKQDVVLEGHAHASSQHACTHGGLELELSSA